jgi:hypothetical protein
LQRTSACVAQAQQKSAFIVGEQTHRRLSSGEQFFCRGRRPAPARSPNPASGFRRFASSELPLRWAVTSSDS